MAVELVADYEGLGEARIEHGTGIVQKVEYEEGKRNAKVTIGVVGLQHPLYGWADVNALPHAVKVPKGTAVDYRIVVHRRRGVEVSKPLAELANGEKVKDLVLLAPAGTGNAPPAAREPVSGDVVRTGPPSAPPASTGPSAADRSTIEAAGAATAASLRPQEATATELRIASEAKPWELYNTDGRLNFGSYATLAVAGMVELAHTATLASKPGTVPLPGFVRSLAVALLTIADNVQRAIVGRVDRMATSHTRARGFVRCAVEAMPIPLDGTTEERQEWRAAVERHATELFRAVAEVSVRHANGVE